MAKKRSPQGMQTRGTGLYIKDPEASTGLFTEYQRVPNITEITGPSEEGPNNETQALDGVIIGTGFAGIGTISAEIGALDAHPTFRFLRERRRDGRPVALQIILYATQVINLAGAGSVAAGGTTITITAANRARVGQVVKEGMLVALGDQTTEALVQDYDKAPVAGDDHAFRPVVTIEEDGSMIEIAPGIATAIAVGSEEALTVRNPGYYQTDILGRITQMGDGNFPAASNVGCTMAFTPDAELPTDMAYWALRPDV